MYDVIIVGGGPAGSPCAKECSKLGLRTLLLEKDSFPRSKPCGGAVGLLAIADALRPTSSETVKRLKKRGLQVAMLTGDNESTARRIAEGLGIDTVLAEILPGRESQQDQRSTSTRQKSGNGG